MFWIDSLECQQWGSSRSVVGNFEDTRLTRCKVAAKTPEVWRLGGYKAVHLFPAARGKVNLGTEAGEAPQQLPWPALGYWRI